MATAPVGLGGAAWAVSRLPPQWQRGTRSGTLRPQRQVQV
jgi:hypothetical protein